MAAAQDYIEKQKLTKIKTGYVDAKDTTKKGSKKSAPSISSGNKRGSSGATPSSKKKAKPLKKSSPISVATTFAPSPHSSEPIADVDDAASSRLRSGSVYDEYDVMLNQTNLGANNNKFYKIQLVKSSGNFFLFTKWGRVGEDGATQEAGPMDLSSGIQQFKKKFKNKTLNSWEDRDNFKTMKGKYAIVEMERNKEVISKISKASPSAKVLPCKLDAKTKSLTDLIFDENMFKGAMSDLNLDPNKLPLGALSKFQITKGFDVLERLENEIKRSRHSKKLLDLTSEFYTLIPHAFGRTAGPVLKTEQAVKEKYEMLNTLTDIESAQSMQKNVEKMTTELHPSDANYAQLCAELSLVLKSDKDRKIIETYLKNTKGGYGSMNLRDVWRVDRHKESDRFAQHDALTNRRLLWHGTNVAVVAAILKSGLRIMPHSGGRVGSGIYLADQHEKSAWYVRSAKGTTIMFLVEAALGNQHEILQDDSSLKCAPKGSQSVLAKGRYAPDEIKSTTLNIDGRSVKVPQGKPIEVKSAQSSSFQHNEFLVYKESQHRIRYILTFN